MSFKIGDYVRVICSGNTYPSFNDFVRDMSVSHDHIYFRNWDRGNLPREDQLYKVIGVRTHNKYSDYLVYIVENSKTKKFYVIGNRGIELLSDDFFSDEDFMV